MDGDTLDRLQNRIKSSKRVCAFTGAGISAESGIPTFRDAGGLWENYNVEDLVTPEAFERDPAVVWRWHIWLQGLSFKAQPNAAHKTLAQMDALFPEFLVITQNIDDLHERAGTKRMVKLHGDIMEIQCLEHGHVCRVTAPIDSSSITSDALPTCPKCGGAARPNVVWFGEMLPVEPLNVATEFARRCDLLFIIGTSGAVSGGYGFAEYAKYGGACIVEINPEESALTYLTDVSIRKPAAVALPELFTP
jgi:NAD-dependent deacetylase